MTDPMLRYRLPQWRDRAMNELLGICKAIICDQQVSDAEAVMLADWLQANPQIATEWPASVLSKRLARIFEDGSIDHEERADLEELLRQTVGEKRDATDAMVRSTLLACDDPAPFIEYTGRVFVCTGKFVAGTRKAVEALIQEQGGATEPALTRRTNYLVIGALASEAWVMSTHGRKIEEAVALRGSGHPVAIVSEEHWSTSLC